MFQRLSQKTAISALFIMVNMMMTLVAVGYYEARALQKVNEDKALALAHSLASLVDQKISSYAVLLELANRTYDNQSADRLRLLQDISRVAPAFGGFASLMRDTGSGLEMTLASPAGMSWHTVRITQEDVRYAPLASVLRRARESGTYEVSDVRFSTIAQQYMVAVATQSLDRSPRPWQFVIHLPSSIFSDLLKQHRIGNDFFSALSDSSGNIISRSEEIEKFVGKKVPEWLMLTRSGREEGIASGPSLPGAVLPEYDFVYHRLSVPRNWYVTLAFPPRALQPPFHIGTETVAWSGLVGLVSLLIVWLAYGREMRAEYVRRRIDSATRRLLRGLPGALVQIAQPRSGKPRVIVSHGALSAELASGPAEDVDAVLQGAVEASNTGGLPRDVVRGARTFRVFSSAAPKLEGGERLLEAYVLDVTELRRAEAIAANSSRLAAVGQIYASVAHELSQPLNIISLAAENGAEFLREGDAGAASRKFTGIVKQAQQARGIVDRLLIFARGEPAPERLIRVELDAAIANALEMAAPRLQQHDVKVRVAFEATGIKVLASPLELEHVFLNILLNAIDAIAEKAGGGERGLNIRVTQEGAETCVEIEDTGGGIPETMIKDVFEPFVTTKPPGAGTGLGLAFVRGAMESFGGRAEIGNGQQGARLRLFFPKVA